MHLVALNKYSGKYTDYKSRAVQLADMIRTGIVAVAEQKCNIKGQPLAVKVENYAGSLH